MPLYPCPECNKQISEEAPNCPGCGWPVDQDRLLGIDKVKQERQRSGTQPSKSLPSFEKQRLS
jgi:hypothetical protein